MAYAELNGSSFSVHEGRSLSFSLDFLNITSSRISYSYWFDTTGGSASSSDYSAGSGSGSMSISAYPYTSESLPISFRANSDSLVEGNETLNLYVSLSGIAFADGGRYQTFEIEIIDNALPTGSLTILGDAEGGQTLTANTSSLSDTDGLGVFSYQWMRDGVAISGATSSEYTVGVEDIGAGISLRVEYTDGFGTRENVTSAVSADVPLYAALIEGSPGDDLLRGNAGHDTLRAGDGNDTLIGGDGNDVLTGGNTDADLRDVIYGGEGNDNIDGGYGNDELRGDAGNDTISGGFGTDTVVGGAGNDVLTGQAWSDMIYGGDGDDFVNGGFGYDRVNGGAGADRFYHLGVADHGSDWIQDYSASEADVLVFGGTATRDQFQVNFIETANAGEASVEEAFVIYRPTGQILWALVDGGGQDAINLLVDGTTYDLLA